VIIAIVEAMDPDSPGIGGGETYSRNLLSYLLKTGTRTFFIGVSAARGRVTEGHFTFVPVSNKTTLGNQGYVLRIALSRAFAALPRGTIVHVQRPEYALPFVLFCHRCPKIVTLHGRILHGVRLKQSPTVARAYGMVESLCLRRSAAVVAVDDGTREFYEKEYPWLRNRIRVVPIGIDLARFHVMDRASMRAKYGFGSAEKVIMFVGRLEIEKDVGFLIESFRLVLKQVPQARLVLVGDGRHRGELEQLARDLVPEKVLFMGARPPDSIPEILNCADVLTLCSMYEGSPTTVKEALACGVPVVTAPVGDVAQIITEGAIGRIAPKDPARYAAAIVEVMSHPDPDGARQACTKAAAEFGFDRIGARTVQVYEEVMAHGR
jgi:glycosyltransferase involved in cell wall biosynthesis